MSDEEVIKRRLIFDGDGTGDDRRLNVLLKMITKWAHNTEDTAVESQMMYDKILGQVSLCEHSRKRSELLTKTNEKQLQKYRELHESYENQIKEIKEQIEKEKLNLEKAKIIKQNRIQYDMLAQNITEEPARTETNKKLLQLQSDLGNLGDERRKLDQKLDKKRKQFHVLSTSANQLRLLLDEEKNAEESMNTSLDDITNSPGPEPMSE